MEHSGNAVLEGALNHISTQIAISRRGLRRRGHSIDVESQPADLTHFRIQVLSPPMIGNQFPVQLEVEGTGGDDSAEKRTN